VHRRQRCGIASIVVRTGKGNEPIPLTLQTSGKVKDLSKLSVPNELLEFVVFTHGAINQFVVLVNGQPSYSEARLKT
jgi:hypothetical protein